MLSLDVPYLRPTKLIRESAPESTGPENFTKSLFDNINECPVAKYIIEKQKSNNFVNNRGKKTELGLHIETCEICTDLRADVKDAEPKTIAHEILNPELIDEYQKLKEDYDELREKYETLKAIKSTHRPILFPHQKQITKETMQSKNVKYKDELLKKYEFEIARLKEELENVTQRTETNS